MIRTKFFGSAILLAAVAIASAQGVNPNHPTNTDESKVGSYTLPELLKTADGKQVKDAKTWISKRRPEIVSLFETQQYGRAPGRPKDESFEIFEKEGVAFNGKATRRQVMIHVDKDPAAPKIQLVEYLPAKAKGPSPMLLSISFTAPSNMIDDPGIKVGTIWDAKTKTKMPADQGRKFGKIDVEAFLDAGIGVSTFYYGDLDPDYLGGLQQGIRARYLKPGQIEPAADEWGSISAWAWGMSRVMDYLETDKAVDAKQVAVHGVSRLGKTTMWAGAHDQRFAAVIASCSGEGGAALSRRDYGERIEDLVSPRRYPYQFAINYQKYASDVSKLPVDAHMLVALVAPRPLLLQTGNTDTWSDPKGEFEAEVAAGTVYTLLGKQPLGTTQWPAPNQPIFHDLAYYMHDGGHGMVPNDWKIYVEFLKQHFKVAM